MSSVNATTSGLPDLLQGSSSGRQTTSVPSRADESFWQGVFDRAETLGLAVADAAVPTEGQGAHAQPGSRNTLHAKPAEAPQPRAQADSGAAAARTAEPAPTLAPWTSAEAGKALASTSLTATIPQSTQAARWQAGQSYGLAPAEPIAVPQPAPTTQAPAPVNATLVTLPNGELKLYLRAAGLSAREAIEAASLADLPWASGQAPDIAEVVLNGQTIYTRGVDTAPSFILTC